MKTPVPFLKRLAAVLCSSVVLAATNTPVKADEFRAFWVDAWGAGFLNASQVTTLVNHCRTYNYNTVIVQMRRRGDAFYMPQAPNGDPRTTALSSGYDALQEIINQCHNGTPRIEVHCWVTTHLIWSDSGSPPSQAGHVYNQHPEYLMQNSAGQQFISEGYYVDPGHPDAQTWNYNMAKDVVSRYAIEGFHWDYIRYPQQDSGYNPTAIARYNAEFGLSGQPSPSSTQFSNWRRRQVTDFLRWTSAELMAINTNILISCSVFGSRSDAFNARFQDWAAWNNEGIIDLCMPMGYTADNALFQSRVDDAFNNQGVRRVYGGQGSYLNTKENTVWQLGYIRNKGLLGYAFYSYRTPNSGTVNQTATFTHVRDNHQSTWQNVPTIPWRAAPTKGIVKGTVTRQDTGAPVYNATVTITTSPSRNQKSESHGKYAFFETTPGTYTVTASAPGLGNANGNAVVSAGGITTVNLILSSTDTTAPIISGVSSGAITDSSATITWTTDESSDSTVEYGPTTAYGSSQANASMVLNHTINLTGLNPSTTYQYRVKSKDASNNTGTSGNFSFTTLASGQVADIIIDNPASTLVGTFSTGTSSLDKFGTDYRYKSQGTGAAHATFRPTILTAGNYVVSEWHPQGSNRSSGTPHVIVHNGGTTTINVNQQTLGGQWNSLGTYNFATGTTLYVRITDAFADAGQLALVDAIKFTYVPPPQPPAAPSGLSATAVSVSQINLAWTDNSANENNFIVARSTVSGGSYSDIATLAANTTTYNNTGLAAATTYYYRVRSSNANGSSANSNEAADTTFLPLPPAAPTALNATAVSGSQINLAWTDNANNEDEFVISRATASGGPYTAIATVGANVTSYNNTGLTAATTYYYVVYAQNVGGESDSSNEASATTQSVPQPPSNLTAAAISASRIDLAWTDNSSDEANFIVARSSTVGGPYSDVATVGANVTAYGNTGLTANTTYYYVVRSRNANGSSANSAEASTTTYETNLRIDNRSATVVGPWSIGTSATDKYAVDYRFDGEGTGSAYVQYTPFITSAGSYDVFAWHSQGANRTTVAEHIVTYNGGAQTLTVNQQINGGVWNYLGTFSFAAGSSGNVRITDNFTGTGVVIADAVQFVFVPPPSAPGGLSATTISKSQINLAWTDNSPNENSFVVARSTVSGGPYSDVATLAVDTTSHSDTGLTADTAYYYVVRAVNGSGSSPNSNQATATTLPATTTVTFTSVAAHDGWVLESGENSSTGGSMSATASNASALRTGDDTLDRQYKAIVSFDTTSLPDGAVIVSATLRLKRGSLTGTNPFNTHGSCFVDIRNGGFNGANALATGDFQAAADATQVATMSNPTANGTWSTGNLNSMGLGFVNKAGHTQFRVYFASGDNDDIGNDYVGWYSGDNSNAANRPVLEIVYE